VKAVLTGLGRLDTKHLIMLRKVKFYRHLFSVCNSFLSDEFSAFLLHNCDNDSMRKTVLGCLRCCELRLDIV